MQESDARKLQYWVESVEKTTAPDGASGNNWFCYIIGRGTSQIKGKMTGSMKTVSDYAEKYAAELNSRSFRSTSPYAHRKKT